MPSKRGYDAHEAELAEAFGLRRTITSGNKFYDPGDAVTADPDHPFPLYVDGKYTEKNSASVRLKDLWNYQDRAADLGKRLVLALRFWPKDKGRPFDYVVLSADDFAELLGMIGDKDA